MRCDNLLQFFQSKSVLSLFQCMYNEFTFAVILIHYGNTSTSVSSKIAVCNSVNLTHTELKFYLVVHESQS